MNIIYDEKLLGTVAFSNGCLCSKELAQREHRHFQPATPSMPSIYPQKNNPADNKPGKAFVYGVLALIFSFAVPIFGVIFAILAKNVVKNEVMPEAAEKKVVIMTTAALIIAIVMFLLNYIVPFLFMMYAM